MEKSSSNDKVSVIIPVYNSANFLAYTIESVLNQTYKNIEIIAVDDGSTDSSAKILHRYSDKITVISQQNSGLASALNEGIRVMKGRWFKWFSPDDILHLDAIETLVNEIKKLSEYTIVYSNWEMIDENGKKLRDFHESNYNNLEKSEFNVRLLDGQQINVNTTLIPISLFERGCLIQNLKDQVAIDYDFFLRAAILHDVHFHLVSRSLVKYRIQKDQLSHKNITKTLSYLNEVREDILSKLDETKRKQYLAALERYRKKEKPLSKRIMDHSLKFLSNTFPNIADRLLIFYLNNVRRTR